MSKDRNFATLYRPKTFEEVVGQDIPKAVLKRIASNLEVTARCIFLKGSYGSGKTSLCRIFARACNCDNFIKTGDVCNECESCSEINASNSQLYIELDATVCQDLETINKLYERLQSPPPSGKRRIVVFDEVHAAGTKVLNALLKLVEEGIPNTIFVFASTEGILPTLESRSICLDVTTVPHALMEARVREVAAIENIDITDSAVNAICFKAEGHMRNAMSLLQLYSLAGEKALSTSYGLIYKFFSQCLGHKTDEAQDTLKEIMKYPVIDIRMSINTFLRNTYLSKSGDSLYSLKQSGMVNKLFSFVFSPVSQEAVKDEMGIELLLNSFISKCRSTK